MRNRDHSVDCNTDHVRRVTYHRKADEPMSAPRLDRLPTFRAFVSSLSSHCDPPGRRHFVQRVKAGLFTADVRDHEQLKAAVRRLPAYVRAQHHFRTNAMQRSPAAARTTVSFYNLRRGQEEDSRVAAQQRGRLRREDSRRRSA